MFSLHLVAARVIPGGSQRDTSTKIMLCHEAEHEPAGTLTRRIEPLILFSLSLHSPRCANRHHIVPHPESHSNDQTARLHIATLPKRTYFQHRFLTEATGAQLSSFDRITQAAPLHSNQAGSSPHCPVPHSAKD